MKAAKRTNIWMSVSWAKPTTISAWWRISRSFSCKNVFPATTCCIMASNRCNGSVPVRLFKLLRCDATNGIGWRQKMWGAMSRPNNLFGTNCPKKQSKNHSLHRHQQLRLLKTQCQTCGWLFLFLSTKLTLKKQNSLMQLVDRPPGCFHGRLQANSLVFSNMTILIFSFSPSVERLQGSTFKSWPKWCGRTGSVLPRVSLEKLSLRCVVPVLRKWLDHPIIQCHNVATWTKIPLDYPKDWVTYTYHNLWLWCSRTWTHLVLPPISLSAVREALLSTSSWFRNSPRYSDVPINPYHVPVNSSKSLNSERMFQVW